MKVLTPNHAQIQTLHEPSTLNRLPRQTKYIGNLTPAQLNPNSLNQQQKQENTKSFKTKHLESKPKTKTILTIQAII